MSKGPLALRTISEAAEEIGVPQHVLRFWETKFTFVRPTKRAGGRRFYRTQDMALLEGVKILLHDRGYTIRGVQMLFKDNGQKAILMAREAPEDQSDGVDLAPINQLSDRDAKSQINTVAGLSDQSRSVLQQVVRILDEGRGNISKALGS